MAAWLQKVKTQLLIVTGDGKTYEPNWMNCSFSVEYNVSVFNFRNLNGSLVDRERPQGAVYNLEIIFQGDFHIDIAAAFRASAANSNPWTIRHPLYGQLFVQPIASLVWDNPQSAANTTRITGPVMETIGKSKITFATSAPDVISANKITTDQALNDVYVGGATVMSIPDTRSLLDSLRSIYATLQKGIKLAHDAELYANQYRAMANAVQQNIINGISGTISGVQYFLSLPALFTDSVVNRVLYLQSQYDLLSAQIINLHFPVPSLKRLWQNNAGVSIGSLCLASITNILATDYRYAVDVAKVIQIITSSYSNYLSNLDTLQTATGGELDSFIPDYGAIIQLDQLVNYTVASLLAIAANAKQQRIFTLTKDNNWINIAYQLYGLLDDDSTITQVMQDNNVCLNEMLQVKKGRQIIYYV